MGKSCTVFQWVWHKEFWYERIGFFILGYKVYGANVEKGGVSQGNLEVKKRNLLQLFNGEQIKGGAGWRSSKGWNPPCTS